MEYNHAHHQLHETFILSQFGTDHVYTIRNHITDYKQFVDDLGNKAISIFIHITGPALDVFNREDDLPRVQALRAKATNYVHAITGAMEWVYANSCAMEIDCLEAVRMGEAPIFAPSDAITGQWVRKVVELQRGVERLGRT